MEEELVGAGTNNVDMLVGDWSALEIAVTTGQEGAVKALLRYGAGINACDDGGSTALHWCSVDIESPVHGPGGVLRVLLTGGADIEAKTTENSYT